LSRHHLADLAASTPAARREIRFAVYWDREDVLADLGLAPQPD
jgi:hypothetical protein